MCKDSREGPEDTARVLRSVRVLFFDFESDPSEQLQSDVQTCSEILRSGSVDEAHELWQRLCSIASQFRPRAGGLDLPRVLDLLRNSFQLKEYPAYEADWNRLAADTKRTLSSIPATVGGYVEFARQLEEDNLEKVIVDRRICVIIGPSGCGKSVIVKKWAEKKAALRTVVFWTANRLL